MFVYSSLSLLKKNSIDKFKTNNNNSFKMSNLFNINKVKFNKFNQMNNSYSQPSSPHKRAASELSPKKQQWALINQYKAMQYQRVKQRQRQIAQQKKMLFKRELDKQLNGKSNVQLEQKEADKRYYEYITQQANMLKQKQERDKLQKNIRRRQIQEENIRKLEMERSSRINDRDTGYHLDIGHKSEMDRKRNSENIKRDVLDTLDQQLKKKHAERELHKILELQTDKRNLEYQYSHHDNRRSPQKDFNQNERVYQYYSQLERQKRMRDMEIQHRFVDEAAQRRRTMEDERIRRQQLKKNHIKQEVKETLDQQVKAHNLKRFQETKVNPEDFSYGVISNVFRERQSTYDKNKYFQQLRKQAQEQKRKKRSQNYMSEQEYRLNMNQLNKIVTGQYAHGGYIDRSMGTIGDRDKTFKLTDKLGDHDPDSEAVKYRLDHLKAGNRSSIIGRSDRSL